VPSNGGEGQRPDVPQGPARILAKVSLMHYFLLIVIVILPIIILCRQ
jgi:hypothetical protein